MTKTLHALSLILFSIIISLPAHADSHGEVIKAAVANPDRSDKDRERDKSSKPAEVLSFFKIKPGMTVIDLFSGGGYYSEILSHIVGPEGKVISHTNKAYEQFVADEVKVRFKEGRLPSVVRFSSEVDNLNFEKESADVILIVMAYHDVYYTAEYWPKVDRESYFKQLHDTLKPGGILAIIDHSAKAGTGKAAAQNLHRIDEEFAKQDIESAGFTFDRSSDVLRNPDDGRTIQVFDNKIRRKTDRFVYRFIKK